jgi:hypothetical protein
MYTFAKGEKLLSLRADVHFKIGEIMAKMHQLTASQKLERVNYSPKAILIDSFEQLKKFLSVDTEEMTFMSSAQKYLLNELVNADASKVRNGVVIPISKIG